MDTQAPVTGFEFTSRQRLLASTYIRLNLLCICLFQNSSVQNQNTRCYLQIGWPLDKLMAWYLVQPERWYRLRTNKRRREYFYSLVRLGELFSQVSLKIGEVSGKQCLTKLDLAEIIMELKNVKKRNGLFLLPSFLGSVCRADHCKVQIRPMEVLSRI